MSSVTDNTNIDFIKWLDSNNKLDAIEELASVFDNDVCSNVTELITALKEREEIMSTGIGFGIAIPHAKIKVVKKISFAIGISKKGINFDSMDGKPVNLIILVAAGERQHKEYLHLLSSIMSIIKDEKIKDNIINADNPKEIIAALNS